MSEADNMFKELGYKLIDVFDKDYDDDFIRYEKVAKRIIFKKKTHKFCCMGSITYLDMQELKAINKKIQELGWRKDRKEYYHNYYINTLKPKRKNKE